MDEWRVRTLASVQFPWLNYLELNSESMSQHLQGLHKGGSGPKTANRASEGGKEWAMLFDLQPKWGRETMLSGQAPHMAHSWFPKNSLAPRQRNGS